MTARRLLVPALVLGAILRAVALPTPGTRDMTIWKVWSFAASHDLTGVYGVGGSPPERRLLHWQGDSLSVDYPPIALAELALVGQIYEQRHPLFEDSNALNVAVKLPGLAAEIALVALVLTWGRRRFGPDVAAWTAAAIWVNPAVLLVGPVLGYLDLQTAVPAVLALAAAWCGAGWLSGALAAAAVLTKPQALFVCPVIAIALLADDRRRWRALAEAAAGAGLVAGVVLTPYLVRGAWANLVQAIGRLGTHDMLSAQSANVWWIFTWILRVLDVAGEWGWRGALTQQVRILAISRAVALGYPNPRLVGSLLVAGALAWAAWRARAARPLADLAALAGWSAWAYAVLGAQVHENHLFLAVPFFAIAAGADRRYRAPFWWVTAIVTLNLLLFYGLGRDQPSLVERSWTGIDASVLLAFVNVGVFVWIGLRKTEDFEVKAEN